MTGTIRDIAYNLDEHGILITSNFVARTILIRRGSTRPQEGRSLRES